MPGRAPFNGAGLLLWQDEKNYVRLEVGVFIAQGGTTVAFALFQHRRAGVLVDVAKTRTRVATTPIRLRMERHGRTVLGFVRQGSNDWIAVGRLEADWPPKVDVGIAAVNASQAPFKAEFEELTVVPIP